MKAPHRVHHHVHHHHAVGRTPKPAGPEVPGGAMVTGGKGTATGKHHHHNHRKHQPKKARKWTPDGDVALCSARALAESLRLSGRGAVSDSAVLDIYWATAGDADAGASILATLEAASEYGLSLAAGRLNARSCLYDASSGGQGYILGLDLPWGEPHAVAVGPDGAWWSWGEPWCPCEFPGAVVEEAWAVTW